MTNRPPLAPAAAVPATIGRRVGAYAIDVAIAIGLSLVLIGICAGIVFAVGPAWTQDSLTITLLLMYLGVGAASFAWGLVYTAMQGGRGSIGQRALGIRLQDASTGARLGFWRALLRNIVFGLAGSVVVGYFSPLFDSSGRHRGWHDMASSAVVVDAKATDELAARPEPAAPAVANPYLPPPAGAPAVPAAFAPAPSAPAFAAPPVPPTPAYAAAAAAASASFAPAAVAPTSAPAIPATGMIAHVPGITEPQAAPARGPAAPAPAADDLDATRATPAVSAPAPHPALHPDARTIVVLRWDDGSRMAVYGRTLFGRNPATEDGAISIAVRDETLSLSKTHFEIREDANGPVVIDRHSTNGSILVRDGMRHPLTPGEPTTLRPGDRLEFGDRSAAVGGPES